MFLGFLASYVANFHCVLLYGNLFMTRETGKKDDTSCAGCIEVFIAHYLYVLYDRHTTHQQIGLAMGLLKIFWDLNGYVFG